MHHLCARLSERVSQSQESCGGAGADACVVHGGIRTSPKILIDIMRIMRAAIYLDEPGSKQQSGSLSEDQWLAFLEDRCQPLFSRVFVGSFSVVSRRPGSLVGELV